MDFCRALWVEVAFDDFTDNCKNVHGNFRHALHIDIRADVCKYVWAAVVQLTFARTLQAAILYLHHVMFFPFGA